MTSMIISSAAMTNVRRIQRYATEKIKATQAVLYEKDQPLTHQASFWPISGNFWQAGYARHQRLRRLLVFKVRLFAEDSPKVCFRLTVFASPTRPPSLAAAA